MVMTVVAAPTEARFSFCLEHLNFSSFALQHLVAWGWNEKTQGWPQNTRGWNQKTRGWPRETRGWNEERVPVSPKRATYKSKIE